MINGALVWDPWLIVAQVVSLQCMYYLTVGLFMSVLVGTRVERMSLVYFFDFSTLTVSTVTGCYVVASFLLGSLVGAVYMLYVIERAKKCLDFSATLYIIHLSICIIYGGWPVSLTWWIVNLIGLASMSLLGEWLCIIRELKEIPIPRFRSSNEEIPIPRFRSSKEEIPIPRFRSRISWLIVAQIVSLQCMYYLTVGLFMSVLVGTRVERMSLVYFFDFSTLTVSTVTGCYVVASFLLSSLVGAAYVLYVIEKDMLYGIERVKKCRDLSATLYIIHLFICIIYGGWPVSLTWWVVNLIGLAIMSLHCEWLCFRRELREIPITQLGSSVQCNEIEGR